ncbi:MAG: dihydrolipoyl dehydrogenase [Thermoanaerobaculia bacterium]
MANYDLVVIGSGPGGYVAAIRAAQLGMTAAIVEKDPALGGVCTLRGCIPTKALLHSADLLESARTGGDVGVVAKEVRLDMAGAMKHKAKVVRQSSNGIAYLMKKNKIDVVTGFGSLKDPRTVSVADAAGNETSIGAKFVLVATGSNPRQLPIAATDHQTILDSDSILELKDVPKSLIVIGSGAVGVEFASMFARFGSKVTIVEMLPRLVPVEDEEISKELAASFRKQGIVSLVDTKVESIAKTDGGVEVLARTPNGKTETLRAEKLLVAVGRKPLSENIGLEKLGIATERGYIRIDAHCRTNVPSVFAIGDVVPTPWLAHVASAEGVVAVETMAGAETYPLNYDQIPGCTYCHPEIGSIGLSEAKARERGHDVVVGKFPFSAIGKARVLNDTEGFAKIVSDKKYGEVLGVHVIGPSATELIAEAGAAMKLEATAQDLVRTVHAHPTLAEAIHEASEAAANGHAIHI